MVAIGWIVTGHVASGVANGANDREVFTRVKIDQNLPTPCHIAASQ